jgi:hypothetical protein
MVKGWSDQDADICASKVQKNLYTWRKYRAKISGKLVSPNRWQFSCKFKDKMATIVVENALEVNSLHQYFQDKIWGWTCGYD